MATPTKRQTLLEAFVAAMATIASANGYNTNAGGLVFWGQLPKLGPDDTQELVLVQVAEDAPIPLGHNLSDGSDELRVMEVELNAVVPVADNGGPLTTGRRLAALVADIQRAVKAARPAITPLLSRTLEYGRIREAELEPGATYVGASVAYRAYYLEEL